MLLASGKALEQEMLGCARCAEAVRVWLWFGMALTLENPLTLEKTLPDARNRN